MSLYELQEQLTIDSYAFFIDVAFPGKYKVPAFPYGRDVRSAPERYFRYITNIQPRLNIISPIDPDIAKKIETKYFEICNIVIALSQKWIPLFFKASNEEVAQHVGDIHPLYVSFVAATTELIDMYRDARNVVRKEYLTIALECEKNGISKECKEEGSHRCFFTKYTG